jgi:CHAT domain-containing protein
VNAEDRVAFEAARSRIKALQVEARALGPAGNFGHSTSRSFDDISEALRLAQSDLDAVINRVRADQPEFMPPGLDFAAIAESAQAGCPLVYILTTSQGSLAFIVPPGTRSLETRHVVPLRDFRTDDLDQLLYRSDATGAVAGLLVGQMDGDLQRLRSALDVALPVLSERLMGPVVNRLVELGFRRAALVPAGRLSLLPLHAATDDDVSFSYTPSARALRAASRLVRDRENAAPVFAGIGNPLPQPRPLAFARVEVEEIALEFAPESRRLLIEQAATRAATAQALSGATHVHLACHGNFAVTEPLDSALYLSGGDRLTLRDFLNGGLDLSAVRLAVLSACQTGIIDFNKVPDEAIGFPAGLIQAGVPGVVSSLWPVNDISTASLMGRFYVEHIGNGLDPASALRRAQAWLRTATVREMSLAVRYERRYPQAGEMDPDAFRELVGPDSFRDTRDFRANPEAMPFAHPYYWAAFTFTGAP